MIISRTIQPYIEQSLFQNKAVIIYGPRQVGKTTLAKQISEKFGTKSIYLNCDEPDVRRHLTDKTSTELVHYIGDKKLVVIDEAQRVLNIGLTLKLLVDTAPGIQIVATGSSSFDLSNRIAEPLTGRAFEFHLYPFSVQELISARSILEFDRLLLRRMVFGMYPEVALYDGDAESRLRLMAKSYLFKDALEYQRIKNPDLVERLLQALALQIGQEVSFSELGNILGIDRKTVVNYIRLLTQAFIIFTIRPLHRNRRKEIGKLTKIYFYDCGIRNAIINNFNPIELRTDIGNLWENFVMAERRKFLDNHGRFVNRYFWRTWSQQEIDLVEEQGSVLHGYEIGWGNKRKIAPRQWNLMYPKASYTVIDRTNFTSFVTDKRNV